MIVKIPPPEPCPARIIEKARKINSAGQFEVDHAVVAEKVVHYRIGERWFTVNLDLIEAIIWRGDIGAAVYR